MAIASQAQNLHFRQPLPTLLTMASLQIFSEGLLALSESLECSGFLQMGVSENSVPLNPMVNDHYPY